MINMIDISRFIATTLDESTVFKDFTQAQINKNLDYYINVDIFENQVLVPFLSIVTFEDTDDKAIKKSFKTQLLLSIKRSEPSKIGNIIQEDTIEKLELIAKKALEVLAKELRNYGIVGETNIEITMINYFVPQPEGEEDLQIQIDIEFEQEKFLKC